MMPITVRRVTTRKEREIFITFPWTIYRDDPLWVPPLLPERRRIINPKRGAFYRDGEADLFIAWRNGHPVGTIVCGEDRASHTAHPIWKDAVIGFFECIPDYTIAQALFDKAAEWAYQRGLDALYGPFNLDYEDSYGVLIEGRDRPPALLCGHTPDYYQSFFERYGFVPGRTADNIAFALDLDLGSTSAQRMLRVAVKVEKRGNFRIRSANMNDLDGEIDRVHALINKSLAHLNGFIPWRREAIASLVSPFRYVADPDLILFAETAGGETIGWLPGIPNLNEVFIKTNGLRSPWNYITLFRNNCKRRECLAIKSVLVHPEYWDTGVAVMLFAEMGRRAVARGYRWMDLSITSEDNPRTPILARHMGAYIYKRYRVYRKWLNNSSREMNAGTGLSS